MNVVTGANGHLGHVVLRTLLKRGETVRATVRNPEASKALFAGTSCEVAAADIRDKASLVRAFAGADTVYQTAAVFKLWARNPRQDIIQVNIEGTRHVLEAAAEVGVRQVIYVSSVAALDHESSAWNGKTWNQHFDNPYMESKTRSEQLAWELAEKFNLNLITVLPSSIIGPTFGGRITPSLEFLQRVAARKMPFDLNFGQMFVDVRDVAHAMITAAQKHCYGQRYILSLPVSTPSAEVFAAAHAAYPEIRIPSPAPKWMLKMIARLLALGGRISGQPASLTVDIIESHYNQTFTADITPAQRDIDFAPRPVRESLIDTFRVLRGDLDPSETI